ncbi:unnamed protein product [Owenia fusiformis]|uniref:BTB/POZ domain-containing protein KCTD3 n=1 Tax=Owenia fusiformis TaxID=6347 RepID=A0A8J1U0I7_OWEFU|nr:unnamed protein product [Owenia fusiformis]
MASPQDIATGEIITLNVGGTKFSTSKQTLTWIPDTFFTSMFSGRISTLHDDTGAIFIDRDPGLFAIILNFLRTKEIDLLNIPVHALRHEAEYYGVTPLVKRLVLCEEVEQSSCGDVLFHGHLPPPCPPLIKESLEERRSSVSSIEAELPRPSSTSRVTKSSPRVSHIRHASDSEALTPRHSSNSSSNSSPNNSTSSPPGATGGAIEKHVTESTFSRGTYMDPLRVTLVKGHQNWIGVAYPHFVCCYRLKEATGWHLVWSSPHLEGPVERIAINSKVLSSNQDNTSRMIAVGEGCLVRLWGVNDRDSREIGVFDLRVPVDSLFFIGSQLVALSHLGKVGVWHAMTQNWQIQDVLPITSYDTAGSFILLLGCANGSIYYTDMQKFPLRMKDNDLLVTELYKDPSGDKITALSVYLTPKTTISGNWIEIAYGTSAGTVRVIVQHPETVGHGPQLFQTFTVHRSPVTKVMLSEKHLVSVCSEYNHVRTWSVTRFRGMISTQPGSMPLASFKIVSLEDMEPKVNYSAGNDFGPFGEQDDQQIFVQKVVPETDILYVRLSSNGKRICEIRSVDGSTITSFCVHECEGSNRIGSRPRRYLFTGHSNGCIQMWDLTTAVDLMTRTEEEKPVTGGPTAQELVHLLDQCELTNSRQTTPSVSPSPSVMAANSHRLSLYGHGASFQGEQVSEAVSGIDFRITRF